MSEGERLLIVGPGRAGLSLGYALVQADAVLDLTFAGRRPEPPGHPLFVQGTAGYVYGLQRPAPGTAAVVLAVPDSAIHDVAVGLASLGEAPPGCAAFHMSGASSTEPLTPLHEQGYSVGSLHPLQTLANPVTGADLLPRSWFAVAGEPRARSTAYRLLAYLGSPSFEIPAANRPLYHAAAVLASNYVSVLTERARQLLVRAGVPWDESGPALKALVEGTLQHRVWPDGVQTITGPVARGDLETVDLHLRSLDPVDRRLYAALGRVALEMVEDDLEDSTAREMRHILEEEG